MGIRDRPTSPHSPWQNGYAERLIGWIRRECLDHVVVFGERHLRHVLLSYMKISQRDKDAFIFGEGCAGLARRQTSRDHSLPPGPGRAAPPIFSDLIYDRHRSAIDVSKAVPSVPGLKDNIGVLLIQRALSTL
jgi:Integrase core domain